MVRDIGLELVLGLVLAAAVASVPEVRTWINENLAGNFAYLVSVFFGVIMYICSTASVPFVDGLVSSGMNVGAGMVLLIVGPITSYGSILIVRKEFGGKMSYRARLPKGTGKGVKSIQNAYNVAPQHVYKDSELIPSVIKFSTDGSDVLVIYQADRSEPLYPDCARKGREGARGILNAFEILAMD